MGLSKRINTFVGLHVHLVARLTILFFVVWFVSGVVLVDLISPWLFLGIWMPIGAFGAFICYEW